MKVFLKGFAWSAAEQEDDSAAGESMLLHDVMHDDVVFVGVYADAVGLGECPFQQSVSSFVSRLSYSDAVDDMVW